MYLICTNTLTWTFPSDAHVALTACIYVETTTWIMSTSFSIFTLSDRSLVNIIEYQHNSQFFRKSQISYFLVWNKNKVWAAYLATSKAFLGRKRCEFWYWAWTGRERRQFCTACRPEKWSPPFLRLGSMLKQLPIRILNFRLVLFCLS